jgi:hypothetical protein
MCVCVYVHVEPLVLSALRDPHMIANGEALLIEHSDRFLSRRRFGGDAARVVAWLAALQAFIDARSIPIPKSYTLNLNPKIPKA